MSTGVKAAAFAAFARVFLSPLEPLQAQWIPVLSVIAALTMIVGTVVGVVQTNIKRMLAYSSIAHAGYLLLGIVAANSAGKAAILFYLLAYAVTNLGALGIVALLGTPRERARRAARFRRPVAIAPGPGGADDGVPAVARRLPADSPASSASGTSSTPRSRKGTTGSPSSACSRASCRCSSTSGSW